MAKKRTKPPINPLSADLIAAAVAPIDLIEPPPSVQGQPIAPAAKANREATYQGPKKTLPKTTTPARTARVQKTLRVRFPESEYGDNGSVTQAMRKMMGGSKVTESDITRAMWSLVRRAEESMKSLGGKAPQMDRPPNGDWMAKAEYDDAIAHFLHIAIKRMGVGD